MDECPAHEMVEEKCGVGKDDSDDYDYVEILNYTLNSWYIIVTETE